MTRESANKRKSAAASELGLSTDALDKGEKQDNATRRSVLGMKDANLVTAQILADSNSKKRRTPSPTPSIGSASARSVISERRKSAPIMPVSAKSSRHSAAISEDGVWVKRKSEQPMDAMTAALLENLIPGVKVGRSSYQRPKRNSRVEGELAAATQHVAAVRVLESTTPTSSKSASSASSSARKHRNRQNLSLDISRNNSHFSSVDDRERVLAEAYDTVVGSASAKRSEASAPTAPVKSEDTVAAAQGQQHLRRRSWKSVSGAILPLQDKGENMSVPVHDGNVSRRKVTPKLSPPKEVAEERDLDELDVPQPSAPRPSLDEEDNESRMFVEQDNVEVCFRTQSTSS